MSQLFSGKDTFPKKIPRKRGDPCEGENLGVNPNRHEFRVREMLVETRIVCVMTNVF